MKELIERLKDEIKTYEHRKELGTRLETQMYCDGRIDAINDTLIFIEHLQSKGKTKEEVREKFLKMFDDFHETYSKDEIFDWFWNNILTYHANKDGWVSCLNKSEKSAMEWLLIRGMEITKSNGKHEIFDKLLQQLEAVQYPPQP